MNLISVSQLSRSEIEEIFELATNFFDEETRAFKQDPILSDKRVLNLFFEPSTRTKLSFEVAARNLGMNIFNLDELSSSIQKGETLEDTIEVALSMGIDSCIIRHKESVIHDLVAQFPSMVFINAGEGAVSHPSQTLLDLYTVKQNFDDLSGLSYLIVGDLDHSRVLASLLEGLSIVGAKEITLCSPQELAQKYCEHKSISYQEDLISSLDGVDVIMALRIQHERLDQVLSISAEAYTSRYQLSHQKLVNGVGHENFILIHPGPVNYGIELHPDVRDRPYCKIREQVANGVGIRMAILTKTLLS